MPLPLAPQPPPPVSASLDWLTASDPGLHRARRAAQAALSAVLTGTVIWLIGKVSGLPVRSMGAGVLASAFGVMMVRDETRRAQHATTALLLVAAVAAAGLAAVLSSHAILQAVAFLPIVFAAVYARRYGQRWGGCGMVGFVTYLSVCLLKTPVSGAPAQALGAAVGLAIADLLRTVILREHPGRTLAGIAHATEVQAALVVGELGRSLKPGGWTARRRRRLVRGQNLMVQDLALIETELRALAKGRPDALGWDLRERAFQLELRLWRLVRAALSRPHDAGADPDLQPRFDRLRDYLRARPEAPDGREPPAAVPPETLGLAIDGLWSAPPLQPAALQACAAAQAGLHGPPWPKGTASAGQPIDAPQALESALQTTAATALAIAGGELLSPQRWTWAVISSFVVFAGARSSGHVLIKSVQRICGTLAGVAVGVALATALSGSPAASIALIAILAFLTYYSFQASYTAMIFWLTVALSLVYGLLGQFRPELLAVRLKETLAGSAAGALVAFVLFRRRTRNALWQATSGFLCALQGLVDAAAAGASRGDRLRRVRDLTLAFEKVRETTRPNAGAFGPPSGEGSADLIEVLMACRYFAMELAMADLTTDERAALAASRVADAVRRLRARLEHAPASAPRGGRAARDRGIRPQPGEAAQDGLKRVLDALDAQIGD